MSQCSSVHHVASLLRLPAVSRAAFDDRGQGKGSDPPSHMYPPVRAGAMRSPKLKRVVRVRWARTMIRWACTRTMNGCLVALFLSFSAAGALAEDREFRTVEDFVATLPRNHEKQVVEGDLNGDKLGDRAVIEINHISDEASGNQEELRIYVLLRTQTGSYTLASKSKAGTVESRYKFFRNIKINKGSLYLEFEGGMQSSWQRYQFKLYRDSWRLIGVTMSASDPYRNLSDGGAATNGSDFNLLTGDIAYISDEGTSQQEIVRRKLPVRPCFLADYDFADGFVDEFCKK